MNRVEGGRCQICRHMPLHMNMNIHMNMHMNMKCTDAWAAMAAESCT
jgi:hypothetical protein